MSDIRLSALPSNPRPEGDQPPRAQSPGSDWVPAYFGPAYRSLYRQLVDRQEDLRAAARWIADTLHWGPEDWLLDLACGYGRHLCHLVQRPGRWIGLDVLADQLREAQADLPPGRVALVQGDMFGLPLRSGSLTAVLLLFNSFGYRPRGDGIGDEPERRLLDEIARVLRPRGRALLELPNRENIARAVAEQPRTVLSQGDERIIDEWRLSHGGRLLHGDSIFQCGGKSEHHDFTVRLFTLTEISGLALGAGLRPSAVWGDLAGTPHRGADSEQLVVALERTA